ETTSNSYIFSRRLVDGLVDVSRRRSKSLPVARKRALTALRAMRTFNAVMLVWGRAEGNLEAPYLASEFVLLSAWTIFRTVRKELHGDVGVEIMQLLTQYLDIAQQYHHKLAAYYQTEGAFATLYPDNTFVVDRVFVELGRLGLAGV